MLVALVETDRIEYTTDTYTGTVYTDTAYTTHTRHIWTLHTRTQHIFRGSLLSALSASVIVVIVEGDCDNTNIGYLSPSSFPPLFSQVIVGDDCALDREKLAANIR